MSSPRGGRGGGDKEGPPREAPRQLQVLQGGAGEEDPVEVAERSAKTFRRAEKAAKRAAEANERAAMPPLQLPHSLEAEKSVLGGLLLVPEKWTVVAPLVSAGDFYSSVHGDIFAAIAELAFEEGAKIDTLTVAERLRRHSVESDGLRGMARLKAYGNEQYLVQIVSEVATVENIAYHAKMVAGQAKVRAMIEVTQDIALRGFNVHGDVDEFIATAEAQIRQVSGPTASAAAAILRGSEGELGRAMLRALSRGGEPVIFELGRFWRYVSDRGVWRPIPDHEVHRVTLQFDGRSIVGNRYIVMKASMLRGAAFCAAQEAAPLTPFLTTDEDGNGGPLDGIAFENGFVRLVDNEIRMVDHNPKHAVTMAIKCKYDPTATATRWLGFLEETFLEDADRALKIQALQEFAGAALIGRAWRYQKALMLFGKGENGKGVVIDVLMALFPLEVRGAIPPHALAHPERGDYARATLSRMRLNAVTEMPARELVESEGIKQAIDGSYIQARQPGKEIFFFRAMCAHLFAFNRFAHLTDLTHGFFRRFIILMFNRRVAKPDPYLASNIIKNELAGVFAWALEGARRLVERGGYEIPPSSFAAIEKWKDDTDPVRQFFAEHCRPDVEGGTERKLIYQAYVRWCQQTNHRFVISRNKFYERLEELYTPPFKDAAGNWFFRLAVSDVG